MKLFIRILKSGKKYWGYIFATLVSMVLLTGLQLVAPNLIKNFITLVSNNDPQLGNKAFKIAIVLCCTYLGQWVLGFCKSYLSHLAAWSFVSELRVKAYNKLQHLSIGYYHDKQTGQIISRVANDTAELETLIAHAVPDMIVSILTLMGVVTILLFINISLTLYTFITMPLFIYLAVKFATKVRPQFKQSHQIRGEFYALLNDNISGMREIQVFNKQEYEHSQVKKKSKEHIGFLLGALRLSAFFHPTMNFVAQVGTAIVVGVGGYLASQGSIDVAEIVAFMLYINMFYQPIQTLARLNEDLQNSLAAAQRVFELIDSKSEVEEKENAIVLPRTTGHIKFDKVMFSYVDDIPVIKHLDLDIKPGEMIAFVGETGVGKTTIASLINRFYDPVAGEITLDGINIKDVTLKSLRDNISMVMQDIFLFNGSVADNIGYGAENSTMDEIIEAAKKANAHEFILKLENGYDTVIGERGVKLSGGQKQRLAIARAILRDTPILILDEATSAVDMGTERLIHQAIDAVAKNRTTIVIAHRLATVKNADKIIVLEKGEVIENGTHDELIKLGGAYSRFCQMQFMAE
ncbi:MAG: ABC transporter ATP-binding protein [Eubacteriales bacterium]|nr:ABC transporter ATP-binding protein [Eubacteriales bacterium]